MPCALGGGVDIVAGGLANRVRCGWVNVRPVAEPFLPSFADVCESCASLLCCNVLLWCTFILRYMPLLVFLHPLAFHFYFLS